MRKRFITLDADERATLEAGRHHHGQHQFRARCQGLLLSAEGHSVPALMQVLHVSRTPVYAWFNRWETAGLAGLANAPGQGRPAILQAADTPQVEAAVRANRQQLKEVAASLRQEWNKDFSANTLKMFFKKLGGSWCRFRHGLKTAQDPQDYADKAERLADLRTLEKQEHIDRYYGDESGFCLTSALPYGW